MLTTGYNEYKYRIESKDIGLVTGYLDRIARRSEPYFEGTVETTYYDSSSMLTYRQCRTGAARKIKFRKRRYNDSALGHFQIKTKNQFAVGKIKSAPTEWLADASWSEALARLEGEPAKRIRLISETYPPLQAVIDIRYKRYRFELATMRITVDVDMEASPCDALAGTTKSYIALNAGVLEVKARENRLLLPEAFLGRVRRASFSKFAFLLAALTDDQMAW